MATEHVVNMDDPKDKQLILTAVRGLRGKKRISWCEHRQRRSDRQNRYYWPCFVQPFGDYLRGQGKPHFTDEMAHAVLKEMFLKVTEVDENTGREFTYTRSTTELNTEEFNHYLDEVAKFLAEDCGFVVADPDQYREQVSPPEAA